MPHEEAEVRRVFDPDATPKDRAKGTSMFFNDLLNAKVRELNPRYNFLTTLSHSILLTYIVNIRIGAKNFKKPRNVNVMNL